MIWFVEEKDWLGRQVKKKVYKKIKKNGKTIETLDPNFFGGGMYTLHKPPEKLSYKMECAEIYPTSGKKLKPFDTIVTDRTRTIELWKEPKSEQVRIILGSAKGDMKFFTNSLNVSNYKILDQHEPKDRPEKTIPFDIELSHMFSFSPMQSSSRFWLFRIIQSFLSISYDGIKFFTRGNSGTFYRLRYTLRYFGIKLDPIDPCNSILSFVISAIARCNA